MLVGFSHEGLGKAAAVHLFAKGYKRFSVITIPTEPGVEHFEWLEALFNERLEMREGRMLVPTRPGLGLSLGKQVGPWTAQVAEAGNRP